MEVAPWAVGGRRPGRRAGRPVCVRPSRTAPGPRPLL